MSTSSEQEIASVLNSFQQRLDRLEEKNDRLRQENQALRRQLDRGPAEQSAGRPGRSNTGHGWRESEQGSASQQASNVGDESTDAAFWPYGGAESSAESPAQAGVLKQNASTGSAPQPPRPGQSGADNQAAAVQQGGYAPSSSNEAYAGWNGQAQGQPRRSAAPPRSRQQSPSRQGVPVSRKHGRPLQPSEFESAEPASRSSGGASAVDVGYVNSVGQEQLETLPYGLIIVDREGKVLFYNETESRLAGYEREEVVGKNFFEDVAPCTQVKEFQGRFERFVEGELGRTTFFDFAFHFESGTQDVTIALSHGRRRGHFNVMLMRR